MQQTNKKWKVLIIGCGLISEHWFSYTVERDDCQIVGVVDISAAAAQARVQQYGLKCPCFTDVDTALRTLKPDLAYDLTYVTTHREVSVKCLAAGCHVFSEKPMTTERESAIAILDAAKQYHRTYSVMQNRRYQQPMQALRELVQSGRLGKIWMVSADIFVPADLRSIRNTLKHPMLQDNAIHTFDGARFLLGAEPVSVYCHSYNPEGSKYRGDAAGVCIFELSDGSVFVYNCVMGVEGCHTSWESDWRIIGSNGTAIWDGFHAPYVETVSGANAVYVREELTTTWNGREQHFGCLDELFSALSRNEKSQTDGEDNYKSINMVFACLESAQRGEKVLL